MNFCYRYCTIFFLGIFSILSCAYAMESQTKHKNVVNQQSIVIGSGWNHRIESTKVGELYGESIRKILGSIDPNIEKNIEKYSDQLIDYSLEGKNTDNIIKSIINNIKKNDKEIFALWFNLKGKYNDVISWVTNPIVGEGFTAESKKVVLDHINRSLNEISEGKKEEIHKINSEIETEFEKNKDVIYTVDYDPNTDPDLAGDAADKNSMSSLPTNHFMNVYLENLPPEVVTSKGLWDTVERITKSGAKIEIPHMHLPQVIKVLPDLQKKYKVTEELNHFTVLTKIN